MHIHLLKHCPDHGPARLTDWLERMGHSYTVFHHYARTHASPWEACVIVLDGPEALLSEPLAGIKRSKLINVTWTAKNLFWALARGAMDRGSA